jgi:histidinol dehydrogenase
MKKYDTRQLDAEELAALCQRPSIRFDTALPTAKAIIDDIKRDGDAAIIRYEATFGNRWLSSSNELRVTSKEITQAATRVPQTTRQAFEQAAANIEKFHRAQRTGRETVEVMPGITCFAEMRGIEKVGLYVPGGTAPLPSTLLMLAIPAKLAGCPEITVCTPAGKDGKVPDIVLYAASLCGIDTIYTIGGAQAIGAMAYGTETVPKAYKIFGPGNQYVTAAKMLVSIDPDGAAIDMPAGPTEVLVIADQHARADFVAADLLAQAEHGSDSQTILVCTDDTKTDEIRATVHQQLQTLPRKAIAGRALANSFALVVPTLSEAVTFANRYAPEHLIINTAAAEKLVPAITNAGSVFIGQYACESAGDYASGTNHSLPTYGYARSYSGVSLTSFQKRITFQQITRAGAAELSPLVATMAASEGLEGHKRAMELRYKKRT